MQIFKFHNVYWYEMLKQNIEKLDLCKKNSFIYIKNNDNKKTLFYYANLRLNFRQYAIQGWKTVTRRSKKGLSLTIIDNPLNKQGSRNVVK